MVQPCCNELFICTPELVSLYVGVFHRYMIDNIVLLITGALHQRPISELMPKCHPLGTFEQIEAINVASTSSELYNAVLVDTPLGKCN